MAIKPKICKRKGCDRRVLKVALRHGDPYCSTNCFRVDHGLMDAKVADEIQRKSETTQPGLDVDFAFKK